MTAPVAHEIRPAAPIMEAAGLTKRFGTFTAVNGVSFVIRNGEFFTLVGPSGSGKTTLLRMLVGMEPPTQGDIILKGQEINDLPPNRRPTCMVFQSLALFPHMTVGENVEFPMRVKNVWEGDRRTRASELLSLLHLNPHTYYNKNVMQCSGGERQRVALARALAYDPEILFFDEPLSAIDARLRKVLQKELKDIQRRSGKTFCYVTHSLEEAMVMSDRLAILRGGSIEQIVGVSLRIALLTALCSLVIGFFAALAYARYTWRGRKTFQRLVLLPLFFPQSVLGLSLLMWFNFLHITPSWLTAVIGHTVWITPIVTLIMSIQAYGLDASLEEAARDLGAGRWQILKWITLPLLAPGMVSAGCFAILLSWGNFALSLFTTGADSALPDWLYARMTSGYQPIIPAVGVLCVLAAILLVSLGLGLAHLRQRWSTARMKSAF